MTRSATNLQLVSAPPPKRTCSFCGGTLTAIELRHDCPQLRLQRGLHFLRLEMIADRTQRRSALRKAETERRRAAAPS